MQRFLIFSATPHPLCIWKKKKQQQQLQTKNKIVISLYLFFFLFFCHDICKCKKEELIVRWDKQKKWQRGFPICAIIWVKWGKRREKWKMEKRRIRKQNSWTKWYIRNLLLLLSLGWYQLEDIIFARDITFFNIILIEILWNSTAITFELPGSDIWYD